MKHQEMDSKEFELPEAINVRDIEDKVFKAIALHCITKIDGVSLQEGGFIDQLLGRDPQEGIKGIHIIQDNKNHSVSLKLDVRIRYGESIPEKAEEVQTKVAEEVTAFTGLHVSGVHVVFKNIYIEKEQEQAYSDEALVLYEESE